MTWHTSIISLLEGSKLFRIVRLEGGKVRGEIDTTRFLDIHYDPTSGSYSYAMIDISMQFPGDKRLFGWDDFPHPGDLEQQSISSFPHHYQERTPDGGWQFLESDFRGNIEAEIPIVVNFIGQKMDIENESADRGNSELSSGGGKRD